MGGLLCYIHTTYSCNNKTFKQIVLSFSECMRSFRVTFVLWSRALLVGCDEFVRICASFLSWGESRARWQPPRSFVTSTITCFFFVLPIQWILYHSNEYISLIFVPVFLWLATRALHDTAGKLDAKMQIPPHLKRFTKSRSLHTRYRFPPRGIAAVPPAEGHG